MKGEPHLLTRTACKAGFLCVWMNDSVVLLIGGGGGGGGGRAGGDGYRKRSTVWPKHEEKRLVHRSEREHISTIWNLARVSNAAHLLGQIWHAAPYGCCIRSHLVLCQHTAVSRSTPQAVSYTSTSGRPPARPVILRNVDFVSTLKRLEKKKSDLDLTLSYRVKRWPHSRAVLHDLIFSSFAPI